MKKFFDLLPIRFLIVGGLNTFLGWLIFSVSFYFFQYESFALFISISFALVFNFFSHGLIVFRNLPFLRYYLFVAIYLFLYVVNYVLLNFAKNLFIYNLIYLQLFIVPFIALLSFILLSKFVFINKRD
jgi:putative flippase GtrA